MQCTSFQVLLLYVLVAVTGGLCLNTVALYTVPVLSLEMEERVPVASELFCAREPVQTCRVPWPALRGCTEAFALGPPTNKDCHSWEWSALGPLPNGDTLATTGSAQPTITSAHTFHHTHRFCTFAARVCYSLLLEVWSRCCLQFFHRVVPMAVYFSRAT